MRKKGKVRVEKNKILIVCGGVTEKNYFDKFRTDLGEIKVVPKLKNRNPLSIVNHAKKLMAKEEYIRTWCVFDKDNFTDFDDAIQEAERCEIKCAFSNKDFELWFIMHLKKQTVPIADADSKDILSKFLGRKYDKTDEKLYDEFKHKMNIAILNSRIVHQTHIKNGNILVSKFTPCTNVYLLVEELSKWMVSCS